MKEMPIKKKYFAREIKESKKTPKPLKKATPKLKRKNMGIAQRGKSGSVFKSYYPRKK